MRVVISSVKCKYCGSKHIVKYGKLNNIQRWFCRGCERKFVDNDSLPKMKSTIEKVASSLNMYFSGMSLRQISRHLNHMYKEKPSHSTIYRVLSRVLFEIVHDQILKERKVVAYFSYRV